MKSVLYVLPATEIGGAETKVFTIIRNLGGMRNVLLTQRAIADYFSDLGIAIHVFDDYDCREPMALSTRKTLRYAKVIAETVRREGVGSVAGIMHTGTFYSAAARDLFRLPIFLLGTIEGSITEYFKRGGRPPTLVEKVIIRYLLRRPHRIAVPSEGVKEDLERNFGVRKEKIAVIYNGVDIPRIRAMAEERVSGLEGWTGKRVVTACRLSAEKDFKTLLKAFKEVSDRVESRLIIVGDGDLRGEIIRLATEIGIGQKVEITGFQRNPFTFFRAADVFVLSSFFEGFGNVIAEAMALGVPVVATDCPSGPREIIQNGVNGFLVPVGDHNAMAEAIMHLLKGKNTRDAFIANGIKRAECFRAETMIENFRRLIISFGEEEFCRSLI